MATRHAVGSPKVHSTSHRTSPHKFHGYNYGVLCQSYESVADIAPFLVQSCTQSGIISVLMRLFLIDSETLVLHTEPQSVAFSKAQGARAPPARLCRLEGFGRAFFPCDYEDSCKGQKPTYHCRGRYRGSGANC
jgi:hypothetical protein